MDEVANPSVWAEYGLPGLVILALFVLVSWVLRDHRTERAEWRTDAKQSADKVTTALDKLSDVIRDSSK